MKITCYCRTPWANRWNFSQFFPIVMSIPKSTLTFSWWNCLTNSTKFNWVIGMFIDTSIKWLCLHELAGPNIPNLSVSFSINQTQFISCLSFTVSDKTDRCHDTYNNMQMATVRLRCFSPFWIPGYKGHWDGGQRQAWVLRQDCGRHGMLPVLSCRWPVLTPGGTAVPASCHQII